MELRGLHSSDRHTHGLESAREPPPVPGGLGQPAQETQWRTALYVEPGSRAGLVQALRFGAEARGPCTLADRSGELLTSPTKRRVNVGYSGGVYASAFASAAEQSRCRTPVARNAWSTSNLPLIPALFRSALLC